MNFTINIKTKVRRHRTLVPVTLTLVMPISNNIIDLGYGYKSWMTEHVEGYDSVIPGEHYRLMHQINPKQGDIWTIGNRTFTVGKIEGFLNHTAALIENDKQVATIMFEDYYKD